MLYNIIWEVVNLPPLVLIVSSFMICRKIAIKYIYPQLYDDKGADRPRWSNKKQ